MGAFLDITDQRYGRLLVLRRHSVSKWKETRWLCQCDCGMIRVVLGKMLKDGRTTSCGCFQIENTIRRHTKHGACRTGEYRVWTHMTDRCHNERSKSFKNYGGRGIKVCDRWRHSFDNFIADMGKRPHPRHSIERKDNDKGYEPSNCKWADRYEQARNRRTTRFYEHEGITGSVTDWSKLLKVNYAVLLWHLNKGRSIMEAKQRIKYHSE